MLKVDVPSYKALELQHLALDMNGTLALDGQLLPGVIERIECLRDTLVISLISADTHGGLAENADVEGFVHIILLYIFDRAEGYALRVKPFLDDQPRGLFATRYPSRPNPIGLSIVRLVSRQAHVLHILGADMLDGTPLLDIKPYVPDFDAHPWATTGWYDHRRADNQDGRTPKDLQPHTPL